MPGRVHLKTKQRGQTLTVSFIFISDEFEKEFKSNKINVTDLVLAQFTFSFSERNNEYVLKYIVSFEKHGKAKYSSVQINLSCNDFEKQFICGKYGDTVNFNPKQHDFFLDGVVVASLEVTVIARPSPTPLNKLFDDTEFIDFQLCAADGSVTVHKSLLSVYSDMFKKMLGGQWKETAEGRIEMPGVTAQILQHLKEYMYLGTLPDDGLEPLLLLAAYYLMDTLRADASQN